jgi:hypothetical protein
MQRVAALAACPCTVPATAQPTHGGTANFTAFFRSEAVRWNKVFRDSGIRLE